MIFWQGLSNALADVGEGIDETSAEEYTMMLEVMMADHPGWPHPPVFQVLKSNPVLRELEYMQVDDPGKSRAVRVWVRTLHMRSGLMWGRLFQGGSHALLTLPLASYL